MCFNKGGCRTFSRENRFFVQLKGTRTISRVIRFFETPRSSLVPSRVRRHPFLRRSRARRRAISCVQLNLTNFTDHRSALLVSLITHALCPLKRTLAGSGSASEMHARSKRSTYPIASLGSRSFSSCFVPRHFALCSALGKIVSARGTIKARLLGRSNGYALRGLVRVHRHTNHRIGRRADIQNLVIKFCSGFDLVSPIY